MLELLEKGPPASLTSDRERTRIMRSFAKSDDLLLSPDDMLPYSESWVAAFEGRVVVTAQHLASLMEQLDALSIPRGEAAVRYIEKDGMAAA